MSSDRNRDHCDCGSVPCLPCDPYEPVPNAETSILYSEVVADNMVYASTYTAQPNIIPQDHAAVLTCMDARILPNEVMGFQAGDFHVIRNAGGRANEDSIRSLVISHKLLQTNQWFVIHHTDCGMQKFTNKVMCELLAGSLVSAELTENCNETLFPVENNNVCQWRNVSDCCGKVEGEDYHPINWQTINHGLIPSVIEDVKKIVSHPLVPTNIPVYGFIFDVITGFLIPVPEATIDGRAIPLVCPDHEYIE
jgi:carbonic anhydrase